MRFVHPKPALADDSYTDHTLRGAKHLLETLRFFRAGQPESALTNPDQARSLYSNAEQFSLWEQSRGTSKHFVKWIAPIFINTGTKNRAAQIFGKDPSPITALGERSVCSYIRHLFFGLRWSKSRVQKHLVDELNYSYASAIPAIARILREEEASQKQSRYYAEHHEKALFPERVIKTK